MSAQSLVIVVSAKSTTTQTHNFRKYKNKFCFTNIIVILFFKSKIIDHVSVQSTIIPTCVYCPVSTQSTTMLTHVSRKYLRENGQFGVRPLNQRTLHRPTGGRPIIIFFICWSSTPQQKSLRYQTNEKKNYNFVLYFSKGSNYATFGRQTNKKNIFLCLVVRLGQVRLGKIRLGQVRLGQARLGQARLGQARFLVQCPTKGYFEALDQQQF